MKDYEHKGKPLTRKIASDLILELFGGQAGIPRCRINEKVLELHLRRGGVSSPNAHTTIGTGLDYLKKQGKADKLKRGIWNIDIPDQRRTSKRKIGKHLCNATE